ncbi:MAG: hypothetical protein AAGI11_18295 [Pseudomonadota bacterium]
MSTSKAMRIKGFARYLIVLAAGITLGYFLALMHERETQLYLASGWFSLNMIDDVRVLNALQEGNELTAIGQLDANVYGTLVGWDSTGQIEQLIDQEPDDSLYLQDLRGALDFAENYSTKYHEPSQAQTYSEIFSKYRTHNK